jgi:hypothetical protein
MDMRATKENKDSIPINEIKTATKALGRVGG